ncbi:T9SS type A sorting domain-containing protein [uncultured Polaribacter sp.]|uniref:T9SS type A sorting domain-containing protein n=1 Tax=uncultured Polaribacter sp. TaxID=174711 RepID=UPI00261B790E|nr:T9SS type A sorting domain-containing protein [uncultured Polaribacter sp.]
MIKLLLFITLITSFTFFSQTQIASSIYGEAAEDHSGWGVSLSSDGNIVAVGAYKNDGLNGEDSGHVRIYKNTNGTWVQIGDDIDGEAAGDYSGYYVSLSSDGNIVAIGAKYNSDSGFWSGHVRIYENINDVWTQIGQDIDGRASYDEFGRTLSLSSDGNTLAIGAYNNDGLNGQDSGYVSVYKNMNATWVQIGDDIEGETVGDRFGYSVSLSSEGSIVAIGANRNDGVNGEDSGHVRIYKNINNVWTQIGQDIDGEAERDGSGIAVSLSNDGNIVAIGAALNDGVNKPGVGHVRIYKNINGVWTQIGDDIDGEAAGDLSGYGLCLSGDGSIVAIGARYNNTNDTTYSSGHVRIYKNINNEWTQIGVDIDGESLHDFSGVGVSLSNDGSIIAIGTYGNDNINGEDAGNVKVFDLSATLSLNNSISSLFKIYPNPSSNKISIELEPGLKLKKATLYNLLGQSVKEAFHPIIDVSSLVKGFYIIEIETTVKGKTTKKIMVE